MNFPNNDLWTVRSIELLDGALEEMRGKKATYYPNVIYELVIPAVAQYKFKGVVSFEDDDRTIMFEIGEGFGLSYEQIVNYLNKFSINFNEVKEV